MRFLDFCDIANLLKNDSFSELKGKEHSDMN